MIIKMKDIIMRMAGTAHVIINASEGIAMAGTSYHCGPPGDLLEHSNLKVGQLVVLEEIVVFQEIHLLK